MAKSKQKASIPLWACKKLAEFYEQALKPSDLLAVRRVQRDVVVIGPDGRKFRLQNAPLQDTTLNLDEMEKSA